MGISTIFLDHFHWTFPGLVLLLLGPECAQRFPFVHTLVAKMSWLLVADGPFSHQFIPFRRLLWVGPLFAHRRRNTNKCAAHKKRRPNACAPALARMELGANWSSKSIGKQQTPIGCPSPPFLHLGQPVSKRQCRSEV